MQSIQKTILYLAYMHLLNEEECIRGARKEDRVRWLSYYFDLLSGKKCCDTTFPGVSEATQTPHPLLPLAEAHPVLITLPPNKKQAGCAHPDTVQCVPLIFPSQGLALISAVNI